MKKLAVVLLAGLLCACGGIPRAVVDIDGKSISAEDLPGATRHRIFVATNRRIAGNPALYFTGERGPLRFGHMDVYVPPSHQTGHIEQAKRLPPDPRKHFVTLDPVEFDRRGFVDAIEATLAQLPPDEKNVLVFIHGYNSPFSGALYRFAQFVHDTGYKGVPVLFTWPSRAKSFDYLYDLNSALASRDDLLETFDLISETNFKRGDIDAHSMGNFLTVEALRQASIKGQFDKPTRLRYVVFAAPDIDVDLFARQVQSLPVKSHSFTVMISKDDKALALSRFLSGGVSRVGSADVGALNKLGVSVVDLTEVDAGGRLAHSKFADSPEIVRLIGTRLGEPPGASSVVIPDGVRIARGLFNVVTAVPTALAAGTGQVLTGDFEAAPQKARDAPDSDAMRFNRENAGQ